MPVPIVIADAQFLIRRGLRDVLNTHKDFEVVREVSDESELFDAVKETQAEVVVLDYDQPGHFTADTVEKLKSEFPFTGVMVISSDMKESNIYKVVENGINSFITKQCDDKEIIDAVYATSKKEKFFCHKILEVILQKSFGQEEEACEPIPLSPREIEIVQHIASGRIAKEIASDLHLSTHTIYTHRKNIMKKLDLSSPVELVMYAINKGIVDPKMTD
ncbi:MAG: response regulator transcription factor [Saprospiraceae bacterium]|nr:response regulator transcription factor [Saprospiraceae bacterium]